MAKAEPQIFSPAIFNANPTTARKLLDKAMQELPSVSTTLSEIGEDLADEARKHVRLTYGWASLQAVARRLQRIAEATVKRVQKRAYLKLRQEGVAVEDAKAMAEVSPLVEEAFDEHVLISEYVDRINGFLESGRTRRDMLEELFAQYRHDDH